MEEGASDRQLIASVLRTSGNEGEELLIRLARFHKNFKVRMAAFSVLQFRNQADERKLQVDVKLDDNEVIQLNAIQPGTICRYVGPVTSIIQEKSDPFDEKEGPDFNELEQNPFIEVNSRDFLASLLRMINLNSDFFVQQF